VCLKKTLRAWKQESPTTIGSAAAVSPNSAPPARQPAPRVPSVATQAAALQVNPDDIPF
jgi:hypothetical protein